MYSRISSVTDQTINSEEDNPATVEVVRTSSGGAQTVGLSLPSSWLRELSDGDLQKDIENF
jgi:hypothetical protein